MEAADRVTRARTTAMTQVAIQGTGVDTPSPAVTENNSSSSSSSSSTDAGRVSAILPGPQPPKGGTELRMVAALQASRHGPRQKVTRAQSQRIKRACSTPPCAQLRGLAA
eukprot:scaffold293757_cov24-Tisochrysis_lutea.AAC.1